MSHMDQLSELVPKLEEHAANISPRRLELSFEAMESNKQRNINSTPTKQIIFMSWRHSSYSNMSWL